MKKAAVLALTLGVSCMMAAPSFAHEGQAKIASHQAIQQADKAITPEFKLVKTFQGEDIASILKPTFSRSGKYLAAVLDESKSIRIWDTAHADVYTDIKPELLYGKNQLIEGLEFTPDENRIIVLRAGHPVKEIDWRKQEVIRTVELGNNVPKINDYLMTPDCKWLVLATPTGIDLYDYTLGKREARLLDGQNISSLDLSQDGKWVAFGQQGNLERSVGLINLSNRTIAKYPLENMTEAQRHLFSNEQVRHVSFEDNNHLLVGYMAAPEGMFQAAGPVSVIRLDLATGQFVGPKALTNNAVSFDPVSLRTPFRSTLINTYEMGAEKAASTVDFLAPNLSTVKTLTDAQLNAPMMTFRVSPDQKWMAGSFKEADGKVRVRLYEMMPEQPTKLY